MCGIVAYLGEKERLSHSDQWTARLEYRGYDSAGVALLHGDQLTIKVPGQGERPGGAHQRSLHQSGTVGDRPHPLGHPRAAQ
jgi:glucosamine 6-phosphate synthetase-like amidotransferase/phosphosugar isomerase protein